MKYKGIVIQQISIFKHPLIFLQLLLQVLLDGLKAIQNLFITKWIVILALVISWILLCTIDSLASIKAFIIFAFYWIILGVASSIGLGTGLHTFVLYLGPHIAKVAIIASSCGYLPEMIPSRWQFDHFATCSENNVFEKISFFGILLAVQIEAFLWGFGTALGQLPPYFAAYKASKTKYQLNKMQLTSQKKVIKVKSDDETQPLVTNQNSQQQIKVPHLTQEQLQNEQIAEIEQLKRKQNLSFIDRAKIIIFDNMEKYGFITILLSASIPNPLFDLAGITCGHFRIPFRKFFIPTFIGKSIIKVHIQMLFVITIFRKQALQTLLKWISNINQSLSEKIRTGFNKQKQILYHPKEADLDSKPILGRLWDLFLTVMILYFLYSILTGLIQEKAIELRDHHSKIENIEKKISNDKQK